MEIQEAITDIKNIKSIVGGKSLEMAIEALNKEIPVQAIKKVEPIFKSNPQRHQWRCGNCNEPIGSEYTYNYCPYCGHAISYKDPMVHREYNCPDCTKVDCINCYKLNKKSNHIEEKPIDLMEQFNRNYYSDLLLPNCCKNCNNKPRNGEITACNCTLPYLTTTTSINTSWY